MSTIIEFLKKGKYYIIASIAIILLIITLVVLMKPQDEACPPGTKRRDGCDGCIADCPTGFEEVLCGCSCEQEENPASDSKRTVVVDKDGNQLPFTDQDIPPKGSICTKNYCSDDDQIAGFVYNRESDSCSGCKDGKKACEVQGELPYCCANGDDCDPNSACCPSTRTYKNSEGGSQCCTNGKMSIVSVEGEEREWKPGDDYCVGDDDSCCRNHCGTTGHNTIEQGGGFCPVKWGCQQQNYSTKEDAQSRINTLNGDKTVKVTDGPNLCWDKWELSYCADNNNISTAKDKYCGPITRSGEWRGSVSRPEFPATLYNLNVEDSKLVVPSNLEDVIVPGNDYSEAIKTCATANWESHTSPPDGCLLKTINDIYKTIDGKKETIDNFLVNYIKWTHPAQGSDKGQFGGFYTELPSESDAAWTKLIYGDASSDDDCRAKTSAVKNLNLMGYVFNEGATTNPKCLGFYGGSLPSSNIAKEMVIACTNTLPKTTELTETDPITGVDYFQTDSSVDGPRCHLDGQISDVKGSGLTNWVSSQLISDTQGIPIKNINGETLTVGFQLPNTGDPRQRPDTVTTGTGILAESGGPMCFGFSDNNISNLSWVDRNTKTVYKTKDECISKNGCYGGFLRNSRDGMCNVNTCTDDGSMPSLDVPWSQPSVLSKYWINGKAGCYRKAPSTAPYNKKCDWANSFVWEGSKCAPHKGKVDLSEEAEDLGFTGYCENTGDRKCHGYLKDKIVGDFKNKSPGPFFWCRGLPKTCKKTCTSFVGPPGKEKIVESCCEWHPAKQGFKLGLPPSSTVVDTRSDDRADHYYCGPEHIPM